MRKDEKEAKGEENERRDELVPDRQSSSLVHRELVDVEGSASERGRDGADDVGADRLFVELEVLVVLGDGGLPDGSLSGEDLRVEETK